MKNSTNAALLAASVALVGAAPAPAPALRLDLAHLPQVAEVDQRYQSYNVEMVEVTGGRFWAPYGGPAGEVYRQRPPLDLTNPRLLAYARALAPAYMRISGTWANNTYLPAEGEAAATPPAGYAQLLTRQQWRNAVAFSRAADAPIVTSFAVSTGVRDAAGRWTPAQAQRLVDLTREAGGTIAAAEFFNEPTMPGAAQPMPAAYGAPDYAADFRVFHQWIRQALPATQVLGPGGVGEGGLMKAIPVNAMGKMIASGDIMAANPGLLDAVSYHFYGSVSQRCAKLGIGTADRAGALSDEWLDRTLVDYRFYAGLRDRYAPGKPLWNTETGQAACGGSPWAATFLDTFRYLNQLGALAQQGVKVVIHNTLATSDYALIDRDTMTPRPSYWAAVLWRRLMGTVVLASPRTEVPHLRLYAQCLRGQPGGVALLALNTGDAAQSLRLPGKASAWVLTAPPADLAHVLVNGHHPAMDAAGQFTGLAPVAAHGTLGLPGRAIAFVAVAGAANPACGAAVNRP